MGVPFCISTLLWPTGGRRSRYRSVEWYSIRHPAIDECWDCSAQYRPFWARIGAVTRWSRHWWPSGWYFCGLLRYCLNHRFCIFRIVKIWFFLKDSFNYFRSFIRPFEVQTNPSHNLKYESNEWPQLFLYSKEDRLIPHTVSRANVTLITIGHANHF